MESLLQDIRYGARSLARKPGFALVAILTLAIGIGVNTAIFSVVDAVILRPLPFKEPDRLVAAWRTMPQSGDERLTVSADLFLDWRGMNETFVEMAIHVPWTFNVTGGDIPDHLDGLNVSAGFFSVLGAEAMLGRAFHADEDEPGKSDVVIISHDIWQQRFGADPNIIGKSITIDDHPREIIGVMPPSFRFFNDGIGVWVPLSLDLAKLKSDPHRESLYQVVARLRPGLTIEQAQVQLEGEAERLVPMDETFRGGLGLGIGPLKQFVVGEYQATFLLMLGAVGLVLLIACANVANLMLARAISRSRELAIRAALGAGRPRLIRQLLAESALLSAAGGATGLLVATWGVDSIVGLIPEEIPRMSNIGIDPRALAFTLCASILTGLLFGLVPAIRASRTDLNLSLKEDGGRATHGSKLRFRNLLVASQITLSIVLLIGAGLLIRSFIRLHGVDTGFDRRNLLTMRVGVSPKNYPDSDRMNRFVREAIERIEALPGIETAGSVMFLPLGGSDANSDFTVESSPVALPGERPRARINVVSEDYFRAMGIAVTAGREFLKSDLRDSLPVALVNETMARRYWPHGAVGKRLKFGRAENDSSWMTIAGVVRDVRHSRLQEAPESEVYIALSQSPVYFPSVALTIRTGVAPAATIAAVREAVSSIDRGAPVYNIKTMDQRVSDSLATERAQLFLLGLFAAMALVLAGVGIYGVISYSVSERTREIGVRMALGARSLDILRMVLRQALGLVLAGTALGLAMALAVTRVMSSLLFEISATDLATFAGVPMALAVIALAASYIPARRATRVDPIMALRYE